MNEIEARNQIRRQLIALNVDPYPNATVGVVELGARVDDALYYENNTLRPHAAELVIADRFAGTLR